MKTVRKRWPIVLCFFGLSVGPLAEAMRRLALAQPEWIEQYYSQGCYPFLQAGLSGMAAWLPWSCAESLLLLGLGLLLWRIVQGWRRSRQGQLGLWRSVARFGLEGLCAASVLYASFLVSWGYSHARAPLAERLLLDTREPSAQEVQDLYAKLHAQAAELRARLPEDEHGVFRPARSLAEVVPMIVAGLRELNSFGFELHGTVLLREAFSSAALSAVGIAGIYIPWTGEAHVNRAPPPLSLPFAAAHEAAHALGLAREDEANFAAWLALSNSPDPELRYEAQLEALAYLRPYLAPAAEVTLDSAVARDLDAVQQFWVAARTRGARLIHATNDYYLRSQGQVEGVASYGRMARLLISWSRRSPASLNPTRPRRPS